MQSVHGPFLLSIMFFRYFPAVFITFIAKAKLSFMAGLIVLFCCMNVLAASAADNPKVLVLHSYHSGFQWTDDQNSAIIKSLQSAYPEGDVFVEYMNTKRVALDVMSPMLRRNYAALYRNVKLDLIIATDNNALDFLLKYGEELFPGVPVVFCGINNFDDYNLGNRRNYTGVREDFDVGATLDTALRFHPDTHTVAMIADVTESSQITLAIARNVAKKYGKIRFVELSGLSETVLAEKLGKLERGTIILLLSYYRTPEGRVFSVKEGMQLIQKQTQLPLYALWDFYMLPPAIGGKIVIGRLQGEAAAEIAIRVLKGEKPEAILPYSSPTSYYFNYDALKKFNIPDSLIPADSIIAGKPDTIYSRFKTYIRIGAGFALGLIATILILLRGIILQRRSEAALRASEEKFRTLAENSPDAISRYDRDCRRIYINPTTERLYGYSAKEVLGKKSTDLSPLHEAAFFEQKLREVLENGLPVQSEIQYKTADGELRCGHFRTVPEFGPNGKIISVLVIGRDIHALKMAEKELRASEERYRSLIRKVQAAIVLHDSQGSILNCNPLALELLGYSEEDLLGRALDSLDWYFVREDGSVLSLAEYPVSQVLAKRQPLRGMVAGIHHQDQDNVTWVLVNAEPEFFDTGEIAQVIVSFVDITALKEAEAALIAKQEHLAAMAVELSMVEERERRRIASELHDHLGQTLLLSRIKLGTLSDVFKSDGDEKTYEEIQTLIDQTIRDVRSLTQRLNPPLLDSVGLEAALEWLAKRMETDYSLQVDFVDDRAEKPLTEELRSVVYQSARELLLNVAKHAGTCEAQLAIGREADMLVFTVKDRGRGFDSTPDPGTNMPFDYSFALFNIQQRIKLLGGDVVIESAPERGTCATIRVPLAVG